eukprot:c34145_g1_i1.p1 GENE.c34145_g1_i1~~c34145_g1_i1.p1  ORF type:complete len:282 (+),score=58.07 c34145_g1_i1:48-893(+)
MSTKGYVPLQQLQPIEDEEKKVDYTEAPIAPVVTPMPSFVVPAEAHYPAWLATHSYDLNLCVLLNSSWTVYKLHMSALVGGFLFVLLSAMVVGPFAFIFALGYVMMILNALRASNTSHFMRFNDIFSGVTLTVPLFGWMITKTVMLLSMLIGVCIVLHASHAKLHAPPAVLLAEFFLMMIPISYVSLATCLAGPIIMEFHTQRVGVFAAIGLAFRQLSKQWFRVMVICGIAGSINMMGMIILGVGAVFTIPFTTVFMLHVWREMFGLLNRDLRAGECVMCI